MLINIGVIKICVKIFQRNITHYGFVIYLTTVFVLCLFAYNLQNNIKYTYTSESTSSDTLQLQPLNLKDHNLTINRYFGLRKFWKTSNLGSLLFKNINYGTFSKKNRTFVILVWKYWPWLKNRHIYNFDSKRSSQETLSNCTVKNCIFIGDDSLINSVDAVLVHIMRGVIPKVRHRNKKQIWVFLNDESPRNIFSLANKPPDLKTLENVFNWSMTYRSDSDVPVPYGRTVPLQRPLNFKITYRSIAESIPNLTTKRSNVLVAVVISNCNVPFRMNFLKELQKHIKIDVYGKCSKDKNNECPGHFRADCHLVDQYYFYLVMENSKCHQYITEKVFHNAYSKGAIPILVGPSVNDSKMLLPPNSYIHSENYNSHEELAAKIIRTYQNIKEYLSYHLWRNYFEILNEHGYFGSKSYHLCRLCEALNYNKIEEKIYTLDDLRQFLDPSLLCD